MPEKRRRNNKNKRKNKNNRSEIDNTASKETKQINNNDAACDQSKVLTNINKGENSQENIVEFVVTPPSQISSIETPNVSDVSSSAAQILIYPNNINDNGGEKLQSLIQPNLNLIGEQILDIDPQITIPYVVESPEQINKSKPKISSTNKSKSLDSDDVPKIVEITEDDARECEEENIISIIDSSNITVSVVEPVVQWEETDELHPCEEILPKNVAIGTLSITTIPLDVAQCEQTKSLTPQDEIALRNYLKTLDLSTSPENMNSVEIKTEIEQIINREIKHRLRKKGTTDEFLMPRLGPSRMLDVIDEEASGESSQNSRRQSYLSDKKSDNESVDDEVFEDKNACKQRFSTKAPGSIRDATFGRLVPQKCLLVGAKIKEPEICEARGDWTMTTVEKMTGAEVVYLTDSSSSTSSVHEIGEDRDDNDAIESDVSIRMTTPVIEVTDTENFLKNSFISKIDEPQISSDIAKTSENTNIEHIIKIDYEKDNNINEGKDLTEPSHEIVVLSTDNIKTNLYVKKINDSDKYNQNMDNDDTIKYSCPSDNGDTNKSLATKSKSEYDLEIKVIKCELNDAINNLIKEVTSDSETVNEHIKDTFIRQDSSSSICSSQCTAKYNPSYSSLNDVSNLQPEEISENTQQNTAHAHIINKDHKLISNSSHVKDVFESVIGTATHNKNNASANAEQPMSLKDICLKRVAAFPFGDKILEELASVSENLQKLSVEASKNRKYLSSVNSEHTEKSISLMQTNMKIPPPVTPRISSLKISQDDELPTNVNNKNDNTYVCLSPSQNMLVEITKSAQSKDELDEHIYKRKCVSVKNNCGENRHKDIQNTDMSLPGPFKSQTGSRLLALICDPSLSANVNASNKHNNNNILHSQKSFVDSDLKPLLNKEKISTMRDFSKLFKPIPPPRSGKLSSSIYENDECSDSTNNALGSIKREQKKFHFSTGNLNKEIEDDISFIQNRHRFYTDIHNQSYDYNVPRRPSLPKDLCDQQMEYIRQKEKEVEAEIQRLQERQNSFIKRRGPRAPLISEKEIINENIKDANNYSITHKRDVTVKSSAHEKRTNEKNKMSSLFSSSQEELQREKMYSEYVSRMAEREERKQHKVIKITNAPVSSKLISKSMSALDIFDSKVNNRIEEEFISTARKRWKKLGIRDPETEDESDHSKSVYTEPKVIEHKINVIEDGKEKDIQNLPRHLQDFVRFTTKDKQTANSEPVMITPTFKARSTSPAVWRPNAPTPPPPPAPSVALSGRSPGGPPPPPPPPVWAPGSAGASPQASRRTYRPVHFEETPPSIRKFGNTEQNGCTSGSESEGRLRTSQSAPATGLNNLSSSSSASRLPRVQNPTVTLLQKAREGQIPRGSSYLQFEKDSARLPRDRPSPPKGDPVHALRKEYASETEAERSDYERGSARKMADAPKKIEGIGPITKDGMPVALRSEVKDPSRWYKKMYDTIHKNKYDNDYVTIRYKSRRGQPPERVLMNKSQYLYFDPRSGYMSEPEGGLGRPGAWSDAYDSDVTTGPRRRTASVQDDRRISDVTSQYMPTNKFSTLASARASQEMYKNQPGRIEDYVPGRSSVVDKEAKQWWDEVMDIFDGQNISSTTSLLQASPKEKKDITSTILSKSNMAKALKESGYESDSTLIFRRREDTDAPLSPAERRAAYRDLQAGGEPPIRGFRSPAPPRQDETEIEYIPISPTLTKIRIHKKSSNLHEVICYPITTVEPDVVANINRRSSSVVNRESENYKIDYPPAPPRRISSKNSRTLKLITSDVSQSINDIPKKISIQSRSNVDFLKDKINHKLTRQNTHIITKTQGNIKQSDQQLSKARTMSTSAPPAINRKNGPAVGGKTSKKVSDPKTLGTSSFGSPRRTLLPIEYPQYTHRRCGGLTSSVVIEGGAGRKTPITNILDKVTSLDKLWSADKRNERIDVVKANKSVARSNSTMINKSNPSKSIIGTTIAKPITSSVTHKSRDMIRTAEKAQKIKNSHQLNKLTTWCGPRNDQRATKTRYLQMSSSISKSSSNIPSTLKKQTQIKSAVVTNLKKKKSLESVIIRPKSVPCHESCSKKAKDLNKNLKKSPKIKPTTKTLAITDTETGSQFGDISNETSYCGSYENISRRQTIAKQVMKSHETIDTNSFFQHLFLGKPCSSIVTYPIFEQNTSVLQKAKMFQSLPLDSNTPKSLNSYLIHRKPVSLSRFKIWDRYPSPKRPQSPRSISWPDRMHAEVRKFDSLSKTDLFGSTSSLATIRSKSEPPINKLYFSQTSRPKSPVVIFYKKDSLQDLSNRNSTSPTRLILTQTSRPVSPTIIKKTSISPNVKEQSPSPTRIIFTETSRPISPLVTRRLQSAEVDKQVASTTLDATKSCLGYLSRSNSASPISIRSPSYRRIHNARLISNKAYSDLTKSITRTRSAGDAEKRTLETNPPQKNKSDSNLHVDDPEYDEYVQDIQNIKSRSERFRELNRYYVYLERVAELEKATSTSELRHRKKDEEIIDFDRWKKIRAIERAEEELNNLYHKLKIAQTEKDVLFYPRDLKDFRWSFDRDRGLRIKEKSVEDLKDHFQQKFDDTIESDLIPSKDIYKPLWRGTSVAETAFHINRKNYKIKDETKSNVKPTVVLQQDSTLSDLRKQIGLGTRLWSSLSMEQVNALKAQLNAIYSKEIDSKNKDSDQFIVDVRDNKSRENSTLHVRCNSLIATNQSQDQSKLKKLVKSESIAAMPCPSVKELKNNVNKIQMTLSENEKRKLSQTLSKELLDRMNKYDNQTPLSLKQELENSRIKENDMNKLQHIYSTTNSDEPIVKELIMESNSNGKKTCTLYTKDKTEIQYQSSASETETASSDISNKTVIYCGSNKEVKKKVEYFESVKNILSPSKIIYHASDHSDEKQTQIEKKHEDIQKHEAESQKGQIVQSQSCSNIKELFGESEQHKFLSLPVKPDLLSRSVSPHSEMYTGDRQTPDTQRFSSDETIWRSRSPSPDPERYWHAYLKLARSGEVRRLIHRFDSPPTSGSLLRRHRSDPEIARNVLNKKWPSFEKLSSRRDKCRTMLPVARVPRRPTNRFMPHIDIISKLAALRRRTAPRSRSAEEALECRPGEVDRIRRRFEAMSLLGQIYTSAPDVRELQDIAPYLAGTWIAHRYPKPSDNNRSIKDPSVLVHGGRSPIKKEIKISVPKESVKLNSILKSDLLAKQEFDPSLHRPASRYEPPRTPPRPPPASWPQRLSPYFTSSKHTVKFQEAETAPEPPRRSQLGSYSDTESPRRYVESDVNIHYRCPVRHDPLPLVPERELARQQAEHMKKLYREQRRNKYLQELQDMQNRRHQDNFTPSQKTVVPLNRYDEADKVIAKALYTFNGQTARELSFRKGDIIYVRRQIDSNWYEGEVHGKIGLFPYNYVEIQKGDTVQTPKKSAIVEGRAKAKFDFTAQTNLELPLKKGEVVVLTRRIDQNWWEGRNGVKTGIFPDSYVTILQEPSPSKPELKPILSTDKPAASPAAHGLLNGSDKRSMGAHSYTPQQNSAALANAPPATAPLPGYVSKPAQARTPSERGYGPPSGAGVDLNNTEPLYVDTNAEAVPYRAMYKYRPQNPDELELTEGDTVYVLEKCDDGWYVGSSQRTGRFGTFPGNYVERI